MSGSDLLISYSDEQAMLHETATNLLAKRCTFEALRQWMETPEGYSQELWRETAELGWLGIAIPEAYGGYGLGAPELVSVMEPMGRYLYPSPFLASTLGAQLLLWAGTEDQKRSWLPDIAKGQILITVALMEADGSWEPHHVKDRAIPLGDGYELTGTKHFVLDGQNTDLLIAAFDLQGELSLFLLEPHEVSKLKKDPENLIDLSRRSCRICFDGLKVPGSALMTRDALHPLRKLHRLAWVLLSAEMAGGAEGVFQLTLDYLKVRTQFGRPIGGFQALKHPIVNIMIAIENARALVYHSATVFDGPEKEAETAARMAKAHTSDTYAYAVNRAIQFHGAIGYTWECNAHLFFRRAQWAQYAFGDAIHHRRHLAELLLD
jgi:alkylation response protein AidB-like acyl-CoA dehydrogenase